MMLLIYSNVPTANDVLVPETLLKKNKSCAKAAEAAAAKKAELRKASIMTFISGYSKVELHTNVKKTESSMMIIGIQPLRTRLHSMMSLS